MTNTERTAAQLKAALTAAAAVMVVPDAPERERSQQQGKRSKQRPARTGPDLLPSQPPQASSWIAAGTVIAAHLARHTGTGATTAPPQPRPAAKARVLPDRHVPSLGPERPAVPRSAAPTAARSPAHGHPRRQRRLGRHSPPPADTHLLLRPLPLQHHHRPENHVRPNHDHRFQAEISGFAPAARPVPGMVTTFAVSPDGSQMAYSALPGVCTGKGFRSTAAASVSVDDLSTGVIKTWQDPSRRAPSSAGCHGRRTTARSSSTNEAAATARHPHRLRSNTTTSGGSLQAHSTTLLQQHAACATCDTSVAQAVRAAWHPHRNRVPGVRPGDSRADHQRPGQAREPPDRPLPRTKRRARRAANNTDLFTDSSGQWPLLWPAGSLSARDQAFVPAADLRRPPAPTPRPRPDLPARHRLVRPLRRTVPSPPASR